MAEITWDDKLEDGGATEDGRLSAAHTNQIKAAIASRPAPLTDMTAAELAADASLQPASRYIVEADTGRAKIGTGQAYGATPYFFSRKKPLHLFDEGLVRGSDNELTLVDETAAIQAAVTQAIAEKRRLIAPATQYLVAAPITAAGSLEMVGDGGQAKFWGASAAAVSGASIMSISSASIGPESTWQPLDDILPGQRKIRLSSVAGLARGQIIVLRTDRVWPYDGRGQWNCGETQVIESVNEATGEITIRGVTRDRYYAATDNMRLNVGPLLDVYLSDLAFEWQTGAAGTGGLRLTRCRGALDSVACRMMGTAGLTLQRCTDMLVSSPNTERIGGGDVDDGYVGYGISVISSHALHLAYPRGKECRRLIDVNGSTTAGPSRDITITDFYVEGGGMPAYGSDAYEPDGTIPNYGVGSHGPCEGLRILGGKVVGVDSGITVRGLDTVIKDVQFTGVASECIYASYGEGLIVEGCEVLSMQGSSPLLAPSPPSPAAFIKFSSGTASTIRWKFERPISIVGNVFHGLGDDGAFILFDNQPTIGNLTVEGNSVFAGPGSGTKSLFKATSTSNTEILNGIIGGNQIQRQYSVGVVQILDATVSIGASAGLDNVVQVGPARYEMTIGDDAVKNVRLGAAGVLSGKRVRVSILADAAASSCDIVLLPGGASYAVGAVGANVAVSGAALSGTIGTDGKLTLYLSTTALQIENRTGAAVSMSVALA